jgi:hypothetical protein
MRPIQTSLCMLFVLALSACGGGSRGGALPPAADGGGTLPAASGARTLGTDSARNVDPGGIVGVDGSTVAFQRGSLWATYEGEVIKLSVNGSGTVTPNAIYYPLWPGNSDTSTIDSAVAPDGTLWILQSAQYYIFGSLTWRLVAYAPGETNSANYENVYHGPGNAKALALGGDGVMVEAEPPNYDGPGVIYTYPYASNDPPPMRTFHKSAAHALGFALGNNGRIYLRRADGFESYRPDSDGSTPVEHIVTTTEQKELGFQGSFAVGPDNGIYAIDPIGFHDGVTHNGDGRLYVNYYRRGSGTITRRIGPLPMRNDGDARMPVLAVDMSNRLYVATSGIFYRFGPSANGDAKPQRTQTLGGVSIPLGLSVGK